MEKTIVAYYLAKLAGDSSLSGRDYTVIASMGDDPIPEDTPVITVKVTETPTRMAALIDARVDTLVAVPMDLDGTPGAATTTVGVFENAVRRCWDEITHPTATADLNTLIEDRMTDFIGGGFDAEGWVEAREQNMALPTYRVHVGLVRE